ncbi:MAG: hypothetical protein ABH883_08075, partial [Candidatus Omnitrophota bacterium]
EAEKILEKGKKFINLKIIELFSPGMGIPFYVVEKILKYSEDLKRCCEYNLAWKEIVAKRGRIEAFYPEKARALREGVVRHIKGAIWCIETLKYLGENEITGPYMRPSKGEDSFDDYDGKSAEIFSGVLGILEKMEGISPGADEQGSGMEPHEKENGKKTETGGETPAELKKYADSAVDFMDKIMATARDLEKKGELVIGIDPECIEGPGNGFQDLVNEVERLSGKYNIRIIRQKGKKLEQEITDHTKDRNIPLSNVVVLCKWKDVEEGLYDRIKSGEAGRRAFLAGIDPGAFGKKVSGEKAEYAYLLEMLTVAIMISSFSEEKEASLINMSFRGISAYKNGIRQWKILPATREYSKEKLRQIYSIQKEVISNA